MEPDSKSSEDAAQNELLIEEHVVEEHAGSDEGASGLELDDFQSKEIRQIFLTTLPEYLEPVGEMLDQLLSGGERAREVSRPLDTTLASVATAASRVAIMDVAAILERMRATSAQVLALQGPVPDSFRTELFSSLDELRHIAGGGAPNAEVRRAGSHRTVVSALREIGGFDASVLERLSSAGLVTVDQLLMADISEIVVVSGLDATVVRELCARVRELEAGPAAPAESKNVPSDPPWAALVAPPESEPAPSAPVPPKSKPKPPTPNPQDDASRPAQQVTDRDELVAELRRQVDLEVAVDETRARVMHSRGRVARLRDELMAEEERRNQQRAALQHAREVLAQRLLLLSTTRAGRINKQRECAERIRELRVAEERRQELQKVRDIVASEHARTSSEMAELVGRVQRMLEAASRPEQQPSDAKHGLGERIRRGLG